MTLRKPLRLVWGTPPVPGGRWHAGLLHLRSTRRLAGDADERERVIDAYKRHRIHLSLRGILAWLLALAVAGYLLGAGALAWRLHSRSAHNQIGYFDLVLPWRWDGLDAKRGAALAAQGREKLAQGDFPAGFMLLRAALERDPADHRTRLSLARIHAGLRLNAKAARLLEDGLAHGYPGKNYMETLLGLLDATDQPARRAALAARALSLAASAGSPDRSWLAAETIRAFRSAGRPAEARSLAMNELPPEAPIRRELAIVEALEQGRTAEAEALAERWAADSPRQPEPLRLRVVAARKAGDMPALREGLERLRTLAPDAADTYLYALVQSRQAGDEEGAAAALERLLLRHGTNPELHLTLALVLADLRDTAGLDRLLDTLRALGASTSPVWWARLQLAQTGRDWPAVRQAAREIRRAADRMLTPDVEVADALARLCLERGSGPRSDLAEVIGRHPLPLKVYLVTLDLLLAENETEAAREILNLAEGPFGESEGLRGRRELITNLPPPPAEPIAAPTPDTRPLPASFEAFAELFRTELAAGGDHAAIALLQTARRSTAAWVAGSAARLDALELPLALRGDDPGRVRILARALLARGDAYLPDLLNLARECQARGGAESALLLVREILRARPDNPDALACLQAWLPPTPAAD